MTGRKSMEDEQSEAGGENEVAATISVLRRASPGTSGSSVNAASTLGDDVQAKIGQHLRAMYDDVVRQGVPDRFMDLLARLDQQEADRSAEKTTTPRVRDGGQER